MDAAECVIEDLLKTRFSMRSFEEKNLIIKNGRLTPSLPDLKTKGKTFVRHFQECHYEKKK